MNQGADDGWIETRAMRRVPGGLAARDRTRKVGALSADPRVAHYRTERGAAAAEDVQVQEFWRGAGIHRSGGRAGGSARPSPCAIDRVWQGDGPMVDS